MNKLLKQLKYEEGLRLEAYICPAGKLTIGYGHNLDAMPMFENQMIPHVIDEQFADLLLEWDVKSVIDQLDDQWHGFQLLTGARRDAVINMAFQLGVPGLMKFKKTLQALARCDWQHAAEEALNSKWAKQTPNRADRVAWQIRTGVYYPVP